MLLLLHVRRIAIKLFRIGIFIQMKKKSYLTELVQSLPVVLGVAVVVTVTADKPQQSLLC